MAGVKGRSGGARPGAGRKPKPPALNSETDPLRFLLMVAAGQIDASRHQLRAAIELSKYALPVTVAQT